jgi:hypothetical protein
MKVIDVKTKRCSTIEAMEWVRDNEIDLDTIVFFSDGMQTLACTLKKPSLDILILEDIQPFVYKGMKRWMINDGYWVAEVNNKLYLMSV